MYLAKGAIVTLDLGKLNIVEGYTKDNLREELYKNIIYFLKEEIEKEDLKFQDVTPYKAMFSFRGERLKSIVERINNSNSSLHINLNIDFSNNNEILCFVKEYDERGIKFAKNIGNFFQNINYKNKGVRESKVYNLLYLKHSGVIINLNIKKEDEVLKRGEYIGKALAYAILSLGTR